jgi:hypothetical protein
MSIDEEGDGGGMYLSWHAARIKKRGITGACLRTGKMGNTDPGVSCLRVFTLLRYNEAELLFISGGTLCEVQ